MSNTPTHSSSSLDLFVSTENNRYVKKAFEQLNVGYWYYNPNNEQFFFSSNSKKILGLDRTKESFSSEEFELGLAPGERSKLSYLLSRRPGDNPDYQVLSVGLDDQSRLACFHIIQIDNENIVYGYLQAADQTISLDQYKILHESAERVLEGILWVDEDLKVIKANKSALDNLGYSADDLIGLNSRTLLKDLNKDQSCELWNSVGDNGRIQVVAEMYRKDLSTFIGELSLNSFQIGEERFKCLIFRNISVRYEQEIKLKEAFQEIQNLKSQLLEQNRHLKKEVENSYDFDEIIAENDVCKRLLQQMETVATTDSTVLIHGESGTGKELLARAIHNLSGRNDQPLIKVNCAALPTTLVESELFGFEKGAFTGANKSKIGKFELANNGTIFLDEIGEMPLEVQPKILRVLQESEVEPLGSTKTRKINVRVIAATNKNLPQLIKEGKFREDLFYRLNVFPLNPIPLRERMTDVPALLKHFISKYKVQLKREIKSIPESELKKLYNYHWPGNIRELENLVQRAMILATDGVLRFYDWANPPSPELNLKENYRLEDVEKDHIISVLRKTRGKVSGKNGAAQLLGLNAKTLESRLKKLDIDKRNIYS